MKSPHHLFTAEITFALVLLLLRDAIAQPQQEGAAVRTNGGNAGSLGASGYSCDPAVCQLANNCHCASKDPPNGLSPQDTP